MKKALLLTPLAVLALASCTDNEFLGSEEAQHTINGDKAILFESGASATTRADITGSAAAALLDNNYVVFGIKGDGTTKTKVFDHYNINWKANTAGSTETNVADWEYVGQDPHANNTSLSSVSGAKQSIKYWDYSTSQYDFIAFSYGKAGKTNTGTDPVLSVIDPSKLGTAISAGTPVYTVSGKVADLTKTYVADLVTAYKADGQYNKTVTPRFRQMGSKVRIAIYETVPGYVVKDVKFYYSNNRTNKSLDGTTPKPVLYAVKKATNNNHLVPVKALPKSVNGEGTISVYYPTVGSANKAKTDYNKAHVVFTSNTDDATDKTSTLDFKPLQYKSVTEGILTGDYIGQASNTATYAGDVTADAKAYEMVLPYGAGADLKLHVDYTLLSVDGSGEEIHVTSASALVPSVYTNWQPNYAYTYIFKISKNTNGTTGGPDVPDTPAGDPDNPDDPTDDPTDPDNPDPLNPSGLYPIVFDAVVMDFDNGIQETITTVSDPSITTYAKGVDPTNGSEYSTGKNIYVSVDQATIALSASNAKLYTATVEAGALQGIDEGSVANALVKGTYDGTAKTHTVTDANGKKLVVTDAADGVLKFETEIAAADATDGNAVPGAFAVFKPTTAGNYVFEYISAAAVLYADASEYNAAKGTSLDDTAFAALSNAEKTKTPAKKHYKIIIVH